MLRALLRTLFGRPSAAPSSETASLESPPPAAEAVPSAVSPVKPWREAPTRTWGDDVGHGVAVTVTVTTGHHGFLSVVGESHYQDALRKIARRSGPGGVFTARLVPEPDNPYDANAVAVCADSDLEKVGYLARAVAKAYHAPLAHCGKPVTCPAKLTGLDAGTIGVVLDFEEVRSALGLPRVSRETESTETEWSDEDVATAAHYRRMLNDNRNFVMETRPFEKSDLAEAVARYHRAIGTLIEARDLVAAKGLGAHGYAFNQTDAAPIDRLTLCLIKIGKAEEAAEALDKFVEDFPHTREMTLITMARERVERARLGRPRARRKPSDEGPSPTSVSTDRAKD